ncbi:MULTISPECIES: C40 family peptidase [Allobacillus]|uniref:C40 family peptidase n=1 Tax=Allobacillus halotolerans TaxID=570278 RepID=A0ABS6GQ51_9BACI|nr:MULTISPECIES: C40 family peptidase [Allobacillus]MBU6080603.1 C40 family peptidase [Allobacillus halotolerans]TSJ68354.1 peptidase [Allobacillus sp. SKP2-8]
MKQRSLIRSVCLAIGITGILGIHTYAETIEDLENRESELQNERADVQQNIEEAKTEVNQVLTELEELNQELEQLNETLEANQRTMDETEEKVDRTEDEVEQLEEEIQQIEKDIEIRREIIQERLVSYHRNGGDIAYIEVILGSKNMGQFISRSNAVKKIMDSDKQLILEQQEDKATVKKKQNKVLSKLQELQDMQTELRGMITLIEDQKVAAKEKRKSLKDKQSELLALQDELQLQDSELASMQQQVKNKIAQKESEQRSETVVLASHQSSDNNEGSSVVQASKSKSSKKQQTKSAPKANGNVSTAINAGYAHLGTPYQWGGKTTAGFDCSGFIHWAFKQAGISVPGSTAGLSSVGTKIPYSQAQPGDLVFFNTYKTNGHIGIYLGNGKFIGSQNSTGLAVADMTHGYWKSKFAGHVRRVR